MLVMGLRLRCVCGCFDLGNVSGVLLWLWFWVWGLGFGGLLVLFCYVCCVG